MQEALKTIRILSFESSCDDTSICLIEGARGSRPRVLGLAIQSQNEVHEKYGGVVPELASRAHLDNLIPCLKKVLSESGLKIEDLDAIAATSRPGLVGSLLVGHAAAKTLAFVFKKKFISCNHLEGHLASIELEAEALLPQICLLVSGGHSSIYWRESLDHHEVLAQTLDDACGEAFDKGAKLLGLGFPGGAELEKLAKGGDSHAFDFGVVRVPGLDLSFSGLKSQLNRFIQKRADQERLDRDSQELKNLAASYQKALFDHLVAKLNRALEEKKPQSLAVVGGVARNQELRSRIEALVQKHRLKQLLIPSPAYCTDNAAMIAALALRKFWRSEFSDLSDDVASTTRPPVRHAR
jgi:N6-L-threonylcarbamoyladenine synthase